MTFITFPIHSDFMPSQKLRQLKQPEIGQFVRELRQLAGLTQAGLGNKIGVSYETVCRWENGKIQPSSLALRQVEQVLNEQGDRAQVLISEYCSNLS